jgi:ribonuclease D
VLQEACQRLTASGRIAYDTEFIGEETYWPQLCLIQLASAEEIVLVDPFAIDDCGPVWTMLADPAVEVVVHAGKQDLDIAMVASGLAPTMVRDTQVLAGFAGLPWPVGLTKAISALLKIDVPGGMTFTAWDRRPLSSNQCRYAADDVRYLLKLATILEERIKAHDLDEWATAAQAERCTATDGTPDLSSQRRRIESGRSLRKGQRAALQKLVETRDALARQENRPPRALIPDQALLGAARQRPEHVAALAAVRGMPKPVVQSHGNTLLEAIAAARDAEGPTDPPRPTEGCPFDRVAIDALWHRFAAASMDRGLSPELVCTRSDLARWHLGGGGDWPVNGWRADALTGILGPHLQGDPITLKAWDAWRHDSSGTTA